MPSIIPMKRDKMHGLWPASLWILNALCVLVELFVMINSNSHISSLEKMLSILDYYLLLAELVCNDLGKICV